jgi:chromosome segregation ATPase
MKFFKFALLCICGVSLFSCANWRPGRNKELQEQNDTLISRLTRQDAQMSELQSCLDMLTMSIDSIALQEEILFLPDPENPNKPLTKKQIQERLDALSRLVARQHDLISALEDSLDTKNAALTSLRRVIANFKIQIQQKNAEILQMKKDLKSKDASIANLRNQVGKMKEDIKAKDSNIDYLQNVSDQQQKIMDSQDEILNEGYYLVKSRKELSSLGIKSSDISKAKITLADFNKVDIRKFAGMTISSDRVRILSQMPVSSYELIKNEDGTTTLNILSSADFWQYSNILIVQTR